MCAHVVTRKVTAKVPQHVHVRQRAQPTDRHATSVIVIITWNMYVEARTNPKSRKMTLTLEVQYVIPSALFMTHSQTSMNSTVNNSGFEKSNCIDHHMYDKLSDTWDNNTRSSSQF